MQLAVRAQRVGIDYRRVMRPGDHTGKLLAEAIVDGAESAETQRMFELAGLVGKAVAYEVGVLLGMIEPLKEVDTGG